MNKFIDNENLTMIKQPDIHESSVYTVLAPFYIDVEAKLIRSLKLAEFVKYPGKHEQIHR